MLPSARRRRPSRRRISSIPRNIGALDEWAGELKGRVLNGRYRIEDVLGYGATGGVFCGTHLTLSKHVAIKILHEELRYNPNIRARFEREALTASSLSHPNCVQITDVDEDGDVSYFVMPLVEGVELSEVMGAPVEIDEVLNIAVQLFDALDHAHQQGIIHRDVKPENVLLVRRLGGEPDLVKLLDFGIAKVTLPTDHKRLTKTGQVFGTPQYMSPEQVRGFEVDERSDLYSTGLILYELLTGIPPFIADDPFSLMTMRLDREVTSLRGVVPDALALVITRLVIRNRDARYETAAEVLRALRTILSEGERTPSLEPRLAYAPEPVVDQRSSPLLTSAPVRRTWRVDESMPAAAIPLRTESPDERAPDERAPDERSPDEALLSPGIRSERLDGAHHEASIIIALTAAGVVGCTLLVLTIWWFSVSP